MLPYGYTSAMTTGAMTFTPKAPVRELPWMSFIARQHSSDLVRTSFYPSRKAVSLINHPLGE